MRRVLFVSVLAIGFAPAVPLASAAAQGGRWKEIGRTGIGNPVFVDPKSVTRADGIVTATLRAVFEKPVKTPRGVLTASRTIARVDCAKRSVAVVENTYFFDEKANKIYDHSAPKLPGYSSIIKGTLPDVAHAYLCAAK